MFQLRCYLGFDYESALRCGVDLMLATQELQGDFAIEVKSSET